MIPNNENCISRLLLRKWFFVSYFPHIQTHWMKNIENGMQDQREKKVNWERKRNKIGEIERERAKAQGCHFAFFEPGYPVRAERKKTVEGGKGEKREKRGKGEYERMIKKVAMNDK